MLEIINIIFTIIDFVSDILVGIGLYYACHYNFAYCSFTLSALPSILILMFLLISCICPCKDRMTMYVKHHSGLYPGGLIGLIFIRPLYTIIMRIQECCREDKYGLQTRLGLKVLEILSQSEPQLIFTCYIRANLGPGHIEWLSEYIQFDERIFSIVIGFLRICADRSLIHSTYMGEEKIKWKKIPSYFYLSFLDTALVSSMLVVFNIVFGFPCTIGVVLFVGIAQAIFQNCCYDNQGFRCLQQSAFSAFGPLLSIVHEIKRGRKNILLICNRLFLYFAMGLILFGSIMALLNVNQSSFFDHLTKTTNSNCNNICHSSSRCGFEISKEELLIWTYINCAIYGFSVLNAILIFVLRQDSEWSSVRQDIELRSI